MLITRYLTAASVWRQHVSVDVCVEVTRTHFTADYNNYFPINANFFFTLLCLSLLFFFSWTFAVSFNNSPQHVWLLLHTVEYAYCVSCYYLASFCRYITTLMYILVCVCVYLLLLYCCNWSCYCLDLCFVFVFITFCCENDISH